MGNYIELYLGPRRRSVIATLEPCNCISAATDVLRIAYYNVVLLQKYSTTEMLLL